MGLEFTKAVLKAYNSYLLKKAKDYYGLDIISEAPEVTPVVYEVKKAKPKAKVEAKEEVKGE